MIRPAQHIIETLSKNAFMSVIPAEWVCRELHPDYGLDYLIEIFEKQRATGKSFYVQLKGTKSISVRDSLKISLPIDTLKYYQNTPMPILFVVYHLKKQLFWAIWINEFLEKNKSKKMRKTLQIRLDNSHVITRTFFNDLARNFRPDIHKRITINHTAEDELSQKYHEVLVQWLKLFYEDYLEFDLPNFPNKLHLDYSYYNSKLSIKVTYLPQGKYAIDLISIDPSSDALEYPIIKKNKITLEFEEILFLFAILFAAQRNIVSLNILMSLINRYTGKFIETINLFEIFRYAVEEDNFEEFHLIIKSIIDNKNWPMLNILLPFYFLFVQKFRESRISYYRTDLEKALSLMEENKMRAVFSYNMANSIGSDNILLAIRHYNKARKYDSLYLKRHYWWRELATIFYNRNYLRKAEYYYLKAFEESGKKEFRNCAYVGDCLFFQYKFKEAIKWFKRYIKSKKYPNNVIILRAYIAGLLDSSNFQFDKLDPSGASKIAGDVANRNIPDEEAIPILETAITMDPLCGLAWFNFGISQNRLKKYEDAFFSFLTCAVLQHSDREAWINAFILSMNLKKVNIGGHIFGAILYLFGRSIMPDIKDKIIKNSSISQSEKRRMFKFFEKAINELSSVDSISSKDY